MVEVFDPLRKWAILLGLALPVTAAAVTPVRAESAPGQPPILVFVTKSDACDCELSLCVAGEQEVINFLADNPWGFRRETIDLKVTPKAAKELGILAVPVVFLRDVEGRQVARFDGFFAERDFYDAWTEHLNGGKK